VVLTGGKAEGSGSPLRATRSGGPAPLLASELKVTGLKRANVGDSSLVSAFGKKRMIAKLISSASRPCGVVARYDNDPCVSVAMTISPVRDHQK
jgi:hypothetical protein